MTDDEVFDHAVDAALDSMRDREGADPKRLRAAAEVGRPWVVAQAQELQRKHAQQAQAEIKTVRWAGDALTAAETEEDVTGLLRVLVEPEADDLCDYRKAIQAAYDGEDTAVRNLRDLAAARVEFLAVVRDYFTDDLAEVVPAQVNALARARRYAGSNPATGLALLEEFSAETRARPAPAPPPP